MSQGLEEIVAKHITVDTENGLDILGFSEQEDGDGRYLLLQKSHHFDEQDRALGMDKIHVQISDESRSCYGGISEIEMLSDRIVFSFDERSSAILGVHGRLNVKVDESLLASTGAVDLMAKMFMPYGTRIIRK